MRFDYYAKLASDQAREEGMEPHGRAAGFVDRCSRLAQQNNKVKVKARESYIGKARGSLPDWPDGLSPEPDLTSLPRPDWLGLQVDFQLKTPWYSKDDRPFHVLDNPVRKDRLLGRPFLSAASWKGLLRWACRMRAGLVEHLGEHEMKLDQWQDPAWIVHLFGNERGEKKEFSQGALAFFPTWFSRIGFEVINPHKWSTKAGTQPIYYEVVPAGTRAKLHLLYAPPPVEREGDLAAEALSNLIEATAGLLETYGISAKRTAGWGSTRIEHWISFCYQGEGNKYKNIDQLKADLRKWVQGVTK